ncbi:hypothetical protein Tco_1005223 [Tanacetum coccineum]|uniref:Uncharacterized protein n=1 Tax=Tanacetum coccineum TaxID=301880 RepID=A0ABQ5FEA9_9ASTR
MESNAMISSGPARLPLWDRPFHRAFAIFFESRMDFITFNGKFLHNLVQIEEQIEQGSDCMVGFGALKTQLKSELKERERIELQKRERGLKERELAQVGAVNKEGTSDDSLVFTGNNALSKQQDESSSPGNDSDAEEKLSSEVGFDNVVADVGPSYNSNLLVKVHQSNDDVHTFDNVFAHEIQNHEQPEYINDTYVVNQERASIACLINNLQNEVARCNEVNNEAKAFNASLTKELESYRKRANVFEKGVTREQ